MFYSLLFWTSCWANCQITDNFRRHDLKRHVVYIGYIVVIIVAIDNHRCLYSRQNTAVTTTIASTHTTLINTDITVTVAVHVHTTTTITTTIATIAFTITITTVIAKIATVTTAVEGKATFLY